jgi:pimeloyl-ACP methyl ester carboxylesterase
MIGSSFTAGPTFGAAGQKALDGRLVFPESPVGLVVMAHAGPGGGCPTCRAWLAERLNRARFATYLVDLDGVLPRSEAIPGTLPSRLEILAARLSAVIQQLGSEGMARDLPLGCFVEGEVTAPALACAAAMPGLVASIVCLGGRPGAMRRGLSQVKAPTLFVATGADSVHTRATSEAFRRLTCAKRLEVIPNSTSHFAEPGATEEVTRLTCAWFAASLRSAAAGGVPPQKTPAPAAPRRQAIGSGSDAS